MFGIFKYLWPVVFILLGYFGYYAGLPYYKSYVETGAIYEANNYNDGDMYREEYRVEARRILAENCSLGVMLGSPQELACRPPERKHLWESK